jgi:hypothetical protein
MTKFETGKIYKTRLIVDADCVISFEILKRTEKTVTIKDMGEIVKRKIFIRDDREAIMPCGTYSMAPCLMATDI